MARTSRVNAIAFIPGMTAEIASQHLTMAGEESATKHCNRAPYCVRNRNHDEVCAGGCAGGVSTTGALRLA